MGAIVMYCIAFVWLLTFPTFNVRYMHYYCILLSKAENQTLCCIMCNALRILLFTPHFETSDICTVTRHLSLQQVKV